MSVLKNLFHALLSAAMLLALLMRSIFEEDDSVP